MRLFARRLVVVYHIIGSKSASYITAPLVPFEHTGTSRYVLPSARNPRTQHLMVFRCVHSARAKSSLIMHYCVVSLNFGHVLRIGHVYKYLPFYACEHVMRQMNHIRI